MKYFKQIKLVNGICFVQTCPTEEESLGVYVSACDEDELITKMEEIAKEFSNEFEILANFEDGVGDIWFEERDWDRR